MENRKREMVPRTRLIGLDLFRIISAVIILMFHSSIHYGCYYGVLDEFVKAGAVMMTGFFILSGYSLWYVYGGKDFLNSNKIKRFWLKRIINIIPGYYVGGIIYVLFIGEENLTQNILLMPMELLGIQSLYPNTFNLTHNGGTWFVSCILICYLLFPFFTWILEQFSPKGRLLLIGACVGVLLYSPILVNGIHMNSIYSNPFLRLLEFVIGMTLASLQREFQRNTIIKTFFLRKTMIVAETIFAIAVVTFCMKRGIACGDYMLYSWIVLPIFILMFPALGSFTGGAKVPVITYLCDISYAFFLIQLFLWHIVVRVANFLGASSNIAKIIVSFGVCFVLAVVLHEIIEKPIQKVLHKKIL